MKDCFYFRHLDSDQMKLLIDAMFEKAVEKSGEMIIKQGDEGDYMYIVEGGIFEALLLKKENGKHGKPEYIKTVPPKIYDNEGFFGELALMYNTVRAASIISRTPGKLWVLDRQTFRKTIIKSTHEKLKQYEEFLKNVPLFKELTNYERNNIAYALQTIEYKDNDVILKQGEPGDSMFFVETGTVKCTIKVHLKKDITTMSFLSDILFSVCNFYDLLCVFHLILFE